MSRLSQSWDLVIINRLSRKQMRRQLGIGSQPMNLARWKLEEREWEKERGGGENEIQREKDTDTQRETERYREIEA